MTEDIPIEDGDSPPKKNIKWSKKQVINDLCEGLGITEEELYTAIMGALAAQFLRHGRGVVEWGQDKMLKTFAVKIKELKERGESIDYAALRSWIQEYMESE